jgi:hypothetical protein
MLTTRQRYDENVLAGFETTDLKRTRTWPKAQAGGFRFTISRGGSATITDEFLTSAKGSIQRRAGQEPKYGGRRSGSVLCVFVKILILGVFWLPLFGASVLAGASRIVVVGVDGLSSSALSEANAPQIHALMQRGAWTMHARAVIPTNSSPNWASMVMGAGPTQHGTTSNDWQLEKHEITPTCSGPDGRFPTMFLLLRQQKPDARIGIFHHWEGYGRLIEPGVPTRMEHHTTAQSTIKAALTYWTSEEPTLLFVHLDHVDGAGHTHGWNSPEYVQAVRKADELIGRIAKAVSGNGTALLITADHGGTGIKHGGVTMSELEIPWILVGDGVRQNYELPVPVNTYDTAATIARMLAISPHPCWIARPVAEALVQ